MREKAILRAVESMNRRVNGGWVTITAHPIFGQGRWVIQIDPVGGRHEITIASGFGLRQMVERAERWIAERADAEGEFQVTDYLESTEYADWCTHTLSSRLIAKDREISSHFGGSGGGA